MEAPITITRSSWETRHIIIVKSKESCYSYQSHWVCSAGVDLTSVQSDVSTVTDARTLRQVLQRQLEYSFSQDWQYLLYPKWHHSRKHPSTHPCRYQPLLRSVLRQTSDWLTGPPWTGWLVFDLLVGEVHRCGQTSSVLLENQQKLDNLLQDEAVEWWEQYARMMRKHAQRFLENLALLWFFVPLANDEHRRSVCY